jgi:L-lactate dehydrogenase complex protein LldF
MTASPRDFPAAARTALDDARLQASLAHMKAGFSQLGRRAIAALANPEAMRESARAIRDHALSRLDELLVRFETQVEANGGHVHWARDPAEAREIITRILKERRARTVTKGKTMLGEEIALNEHLEANGITPVETDLGEYIVQLRGERPSHIIGPALHLRREDVEDTFRKAHTALDFERDFLTRGDLVAEARAVMREHFLAADAGITGANFLVAETGTAVIVTNEGNGDLTRLMPKTHIVLTGIEKVVETLDDASFLLRMLTRAATGQDISTYVSFMSGPRREGETDGPREFHVVLLDNGRSSLVGSPAEEVLRCIRCAACINHCPVYGAVGGHAYGAVYSGPIGAALNPGLLGIEEAQHLPNASTFCRRCDSVCPVKIPLTRIMRHWRNVAFEAGAVPRGFRRGMKVWAWLAKRPLTYLRVSGWLARLSRPFVAGTRIRWLPMGRGWFKERDLAPPSQTTFQEQWHSRRRAR